MSIELTQIVNCDITKRNFQFACCSTSEVITHIVTMSLKSILTLSLLTVPFIYLTARVGVTAVHFGMSVMEMNVVLPSNPQWGCLM